MNTLVKIIIENKTQRNLGFIMCIEAVFNDINEAMKSNTKMSFYHESNPAVLTVKTKKNK